MKEFSKVADFKIDIRHGESLTVHSGKTEKQALFRR